MEAIIIFKEKIRLANNQIYEIDNIVNMSNLLQIDIDSNVDVSALLADMSFFNVVEILTRKEQICGTYEGYTTLYLQDGNRIILSNDGTVYEEPKTNEDDPIQEDILTLDEAKSLKIQELRSICNKMIEDGIDVEINGAMEHFSYKLEDQNNIKDAFDLSYATKMEVPYHHNNGSCKLYTLEQISSVYVAAKTNLTHHETYFNQMKIYIKSLDNIDEVCAIKYGDELTGEYLDNYNMIMEHAATLVNAFLNGGASE